MHRVVVALVGILALAGRASAQTATVNGTVVDQANLAVPGATVTLSESAANATTTSDARGEYSFKDVPAGSYRVRATLVGFAPAVRENVSVSSASVTVQALTLTIAAVSDTVVVTASRSDEKLIDAPGGQRDSDVGARHQRHHGDDDSDPVVGAREHLGTELW